MAIKKIALISPEVLEREQDGSLVKTAAARLSIMESNNEAAKVIKAEMAKHSTALFFKAKAIAADEVNSNGDYFSWEELKKSYRTFIGVPFFTNHNNQDIENARGKIVWAELNPSDKSIYVVGYVDAEAYPHICRGIKENYMEGVSMGCSVDYSVCSICKNKASSVDEYCPHIKNRKGRKFSGSAKNVQTGETLTYHDALVYEENYGVRFIELSGVADPACRSCRIQGVYDQQEALQHTAQCLSKAAYVENGIRMFRAASIVQEAGSQQVQQLEQILQQLEEINADLIHNRKNVEMTFAADGVQILAELQDWVDELVGAGYGQLQSAPGTIPGVEANPPAAGAPPSVEPPPSTGTPPQMSPPISHRTQPAGLPMEISQNTPSIGSISGSPSSPLVQTPTKPTAPVRPLAEIINTNLTKIADKIAILNLMLKGDESMQRRLPPIVARQQEEAKQILGASWKEKQATTENNDAQRSDLIKGGGNMTTVNASRTEAPEQITEKQLDSSKGYHPRENNDREVVTQKQLESVREGEEKTTITERQLDSKRQESSPSGITQKQLEGERKNEDPSVVTEKQLEGERKNDTKVVVTEKQLEAKPSTGEFTGTTKSASEIVSSVIHVLASAVNDEEASASMVHGVANELTHNLKAKNDLLSEISNPEVTVVSSTGKTASTRKAMYLKASILNGLKKLVASDTGVNPEDVVYVMEAIAEKPEVSTKRIDNTAKELSEKAAKQASVIKSKKSDILSALAGEVDPVNDKPNKNTEENTPKIERETKEARIEERKQFSKLASRVPNYLIEASLDEVGLTPEILANESEAKKMILAFAKGVSASHSKKFAGITNVTVDGAKLNIAIQWDEEENKVELEIPEGESPDLSPESTNPEGDVTGEGMDSLATPPPAGLQPSPTPPPAGTPPVPAPAGTPTPMASASNKLNKEAQMPGGPMPPGAPPAGGMTPSSAPQGETPMPALTGTEDNEEPVGEADRPGQFPAGTVCHFCGSKDVDVGKEGRGPGVSECNNCGAVWETLVTINVLNPEDVEFKDKNESKVEEPEEPELPSMPVAAQSTVSTKGMLRLAEMEKQHGHVCPGCGQTECKAIKQTAGRVEYICPSCETKSVKELLVNTDNPSQAVLRVSWDMDPKKIVGDCPTCKEAAKRFAARIKVAHMMKSAALKQRETPFPKANCIERIARRWGINAVATFGPCKGKPLAECVCKELEAFGFNSVNKMMKLAEVYSQEDGMDECLRDQLSKGFKLATAQQMCNAMKKIYADAVETNPYILAWAEDKEFNSFELEEMDRQAHPVADESPSAPIASEEPPTEEIANDDIGAPLDKETVSIEVPVEVAEDIKDQLETKTEEAPAVDTKVVDGAPEIGSAAEVEVSQPITASTEGNKTMQKEAKTPTMVENIETEVKAGVPRGQATIGGESAQNINVKEAKPEIPRKNQTLGNEGKDNIDVELKEVDIPTGDAFMGGEAEAQKGMPENSVKSKGTVIAENKESSAITKEAKSPKMVKNVETEVSSGVPRNDAKMGEESKVDGGLNTPNNDPEIPRKNQTLGNEGKDNIDVATKELDVPTGDAFMGGEAEAQKGMPENSVKSKGTVIAENEKRIQHEAKLKEARREKARMVAAQYLGLGVITKEQYPQLVEDLALLPINRIESFAEMTLGKVQVKTAAAPAPVLTAAVVVESKTPEAPVEATQAQKLAGLFTCGNKALTEQKDKK